MENKQKKLFSKPAFSAQQIAELLYADAPQVLLPTKEQEAVITSPLETQQLVVAGAGSGKTETISQRVVWLVANAFVAPENIVGLTFTNKAAGELAERISERITKFFTSATNRQEQLTSAQRERLYIAQQNLAEGLNQPQIFTYNAFAANIVQEFGAEQGIGGASNIIDAAGALQLAQEVVKDIPGEDFSQLDSSLNSIAEKIKELENALTDNGAATQAVSDLADKVWSVRSLPLGNSRVRSEFVKEVKDASERLAKTQLLLPYVEAYRALKKERGVQEFSDQVASATQLVTASKQATAILRARHRVILLDEVQDTSVGQLELLSTLFAGMSVMGVGDPHQSIYGWRGAAADGIGDFLNHFAQPVSPGETKQPGQVLTLSTSWRNSQAVLAVSNLIAAPLSLTSKVNVPELAARPNAKTGTVECQIFETDTEEIAAVTTQIKTLRDYAIAHNEPLPTIAIILRKRSPMPQIAAALTKLGIPNTIVGVGGLLETPEVADLLSCARVVARLDEANSLIRILAGPRFSVGINDLQELSKLTKTNSKHSHKLVPTPESVLTTTFVLDSLVDMQADDEQLARFSSSGRARLLEAARMLRRLRKASRLGPLDLLYQIQQELFLDIELALNPHYADPVSGAPVVDPLSNLDALTKHVANYLRVYPDADIAQVLNWLDTAVATDEFAAAEITPSSDTVQILTVHASKGLEWDAVFMPQLNDGDLPSANRTDASGWFNVGKLPDPLRKDAASRAQFDFSVVETQQDFADVFRQYKTLIAQKHSADERRVAYVAFTRAKNWLFLSCSLWRGQNQRQKLVSNYLAEILGTSVRELSKSKHTKNPQLAVTQTATWPQSPLGSRAHNFAAAKTAVEAALHSLESAKTCTEPVSGTAVDQAAAVNSQAFQQEVLSANQQLLLAEYLQMRKNSAVQPQITKLNASQLGFAVANPEDYLLQQVRPVPLKPQRQAVQGTYFHSWVEKYFTAVQVQQPTLKGLEKPLQLPAHEQAIVAQHEKQLRKLQDTFLSSKWAKKLPLHVELQLHLPFAGVNVPCKMDAVFAWEAGTGEAQIEIVDWKTGRPPTDEIELEDKFMQLQLYRFAYAREYGVALENIDATLFYVGANKAYSISDYSRIAALTQDELAAVFTAALEGDQ